MLYRAGVIECVVERSEKIHPKPQLKGNHSQIWRAELLD